MILYYIILYHIILLKYLFLFLLYSFCRGCGHLGAKLSFYRPGHEISCRDPKFHDQADKCSTSSVICRLLR